MAFETLEEATTAFEAEQQAKAEALDKVKGYKDKLGDVENLESFTELKTQRDALKVKASKVTDLEKQVKELKKAQNNGEGDEDIAKKLADKEAELETLSGELTTYKTKAEQMEADTIKELIAKLPEGDEDLKELADMLAEKKDIPALRLLVKKHSVKGATEVHNGNGGADVKLTDKQKEEARAMNLDDKGYLKVMAVKNKEKENK